MSNDPFAQFNLDLPNFPDAGCRNSHFEPDLWFPESIRDAQAKWQQIDIAKFHCNRCPHLVQCLQFALDNNIADGIWGGQTEDERKQYQQQVKTINERQRKLDEVRALLDRGLALEKALAEVGLAFNSYERYLQFEKQGWPKTSQKAKENK